MELHLAVRQRTNYATAFALVGDVHNVLRRTFRLEPGFGRTGARAYLTERLTKVDLRVSGNWRVVTQDKDKMLAPGFPQEITIVFAEGLRKIDAAYLCPERR
jgi:hypothetical protein